MISCHLILSHRVYSRITRSWAPEQRGGWVFQEIYSVWDYCVVSLGSIPRSRIRHPLVAMSGPYLLHFVR